MSKNVTIIVLILVVIIAAGLLIWYFTGDKADDTKTNTNKAVTTNTNTATRPTPPEKTVWIVDGDYNPAVLTIETGETVTWVNKDSIKRTVASNPHPAHDILPELESDELELDDTYTFTFDTAGEFYYHDHLNPIKQGKVVVE